MVKELKADICVIGGGSGGLSVAAGASQMGASTVLVEKGLMGGDCLNYGCVPSKALLAAAHAAENARNAHRFGVKTGPVQIDDQAVYRHVADTIAAIAPLDSVERFEGLGVTVIQDAARFTGTTEITAGDVRIKARRVVVATGSTPFVPPIAGIDDVPYLTNETIFGLAHLPDHLIVVGGGPIGIEMAQAHRHLGCRVTVLEAAIILPKDDPELVATLRRQLIADGIDLRDGVKVVKVESDTDGVVAIIENGDKQERIQGSHLLVAAGRRPSVAGLDLETAGIEYDGKGIKVDSRLRTTNRKVFAIGDVAGGYQFTHVAGYHAGIVIRNALLRLPAKADYRAVPWVTYTAPELAQVGLTEAQAMESHDDIRILKFPFAENDRARAEGVTDGLVKVVTTKRGTILGAGIVGPAAGDLIVPWVLALTKSLKIGAIAGMIVPYPTLSEVGKRAAGSFYTPSLFSARMRMLVRFLAKFG
jgi:pyruvate/2-oxoglutarate dehydrogenase complex dihydrolipoamide dehydrogenase (E3) component